VYRWCREVGLQEADAFDVGQEVFRAVWSKIGEFRRTEPGSSFRGWLRVITRNKLYDFLRGQAGTAQAVGGTEAQRLLQQFTKDELLRRDDTSDYQDRLIVYRRAVRLILEDCEERTRTAFWRVVMEGHAVKEVAQDLGLSVNAIYLLKSRLLRRMREEFEGCVEM
jgi:RNA polymerase sigma-70 factor (ECF subfamily)